MKSKILIASAVLLGSSVVMAAPVQAHDNNLWPLYGLTGLILYDNITSHHHDRHKHRYYDDHRGQYKHRRHHSYGRQSGHNYRQRDKHRRYR